MTADELWDTIAREFVAAFTQISDEDVEPDALDPASFNPPYSDWRRQTDPLSALTQAQPEELEYDKLVENDPESILARDMKLDHIRRFAGAYGHSRYDSWVSKG